jgi:anaerobic ribonucleoside-triphosphate reductase
METSKQTSDTVDADAEVKVPCEVYSRVVGYLRPVEAWNEGKRQEYSERTPFRMPTPEESTVRE